MEDDKLIILGHENPDVDSIVSGIILEYYINHHTKYHGEFVIPDSEIRKDTQRICDMYSIDYKLHQRELTSDDKFIILVDHNEREIDDAEIIAIYDHHPTTKQNYCPVYHNEKISSTAALLTQGRESYFPIELLELAVMATFVDTASFNSTKAQEKDKIWADEMIRIFNFNKEKMYEVGLALTDLTDLEEAAFTCLKRYEIEDKQVEVSVIQIDSTKTSDEEMDKIKEIVIKYFLGKNLDVFVLVVHDMNLMKSTAYKVFGDGIEIDEYDQYTSRGNVIIPKLEKEISTHFLLEGDERKKKNYI